MALACEVLYHTCWLHGIGPIGLLWLLPTSKASLYSLTQATGINWLVSFFARASQADPSGFGKKWCVGRKEEWPLLLRSFKTISGCMGWVWKASSGLYQPLRHHYTPKWSESIGFCFGQFQPSVPVLFCKWYVVVWGMMAAASQLIQNTYW